MAPLLIAVDFDGTITLRDTLHVIVDAYGRAGIWDELEPSLRAGEITEQQAMQQQFATVTASHDQVIELILNNAGTRDGFTDLVAFANDAGHRLVVMTGGFRCVVDEVLDGLDVGHLEVVANDAVFSTDGCSLVWSEHRGEFCQVCKRRCKRHAIHERLGDCRLVYVGNDISDRCASLLADVVFARAGLAEWLDDQGVDYRPYDDFFDVMRVLQHDPVVVKAT